MNVIQMEMGPRSVVFEDAIRVDAIKDYVIAGLDRARAHNVSVCLLLSAHYFPDWVLKRWPEIRVPSGFLKNSVDAPQAREVYETYLRTIIPMIKDHPALQSICLTNEPVSLGSQHDRFRLPLWHAYLRERHGSIGALNELYGTNHVLFAQFPHPKLSFEEEPGPLWDAVRFNQRQFAEWHGWMKDIIHEMAPGLPCHAKVMPLPTRPDTVFWGTDPWDFAELSQLNGNDCYFLPHDQGARWQSTWIIQNMYYDLQRSAKKVPVFNTENHIIRDRETRYVSPAHIYTAIWQGAITGREEARRGRGSGPTTARAISRA